MMKYCPVALLVTLLLASSADADLVLSFSPADATIFVGDSIDVELVLTQSGTIVGTDITANGLVAVDVELLLDTSAALVTAISAGPGFEDSLFGSDPMARLMSIQSISVNGVTAPLGSPTSIVLGTFTFTGNAVGTTIATTWDTMFTEFVFAENPSLAPDIDELIFGSESFTVNVVPVPEPSSMAMLGASIGLLVARKVLSRRTRFLPW
jgi:hypothetical protein